MIVSGLAGDREIIYTLGDEEYPYIVENVFLNVELNISTTTEKAPVLGVYSEEVQTGWVYDETFLVDKNSVSTLYDTYTGGNSFLLKDGTIKEDWCSGSVDDLSVTLSKEYNPVIATGEFSVHSTTRNLFSDLSVTSSFSSTEFIVHEDIVESSIEISSYRRDQSLLNIRYQPWLKVDEFSGTYLREFTVSGTTVTLSEDPIRQHGLEFPYATYELVTENCIHLGRGTSSQKDFFMEYFPVITDSVIAYVVYDDKTVERWMIVDNFDYASRSDAHLVLNKDLGVISCGGVEHDPLVLREDISKTDTEISFYTPKRISEYPTKGIIKIGDEYIAFTDRTVNSFKGCIRGYNSSTSASAVTGDVILFMRRGYPITLDADLYVSYQSTARIDYEITDCSSRTGECDIRPSSQPEASQIVQISSRLSDLDSILLESDKVSLGSNRYGPIYFGNDISRLTATALDSEGNPVDNLEITIEILPTVIGLLDGEMTEVTKVSNSDGKIFTYYNSPIDSDDFSTKFDSVSYTSGLTTFQLTNIDQFTTVDEVFLFQLFKHDPTFGTVGEGFVTAGSGVAPYWNPASTRPGAAASIEVIGNPSRNFEGGIIYLLDSMNVLWTRTIAQIEGSIIYITETVPTLAVLKVYLLRESDIEWDPTTLNGLPVIVYEYTNDALHPVSGLAGAYSPIRPLSITGTTVSYSQVLPQAAPNQMESNLGGYMIIAPVTVSFRASATDPYSGEVIYSNIIYLTVKLPNYLVGVDNSGILPVPKGFNLIVDEENYGTGLGGANFYTINKSGGLFGLQLRFNN